MQRYLLRDATTTVAGTPERMEGRGKMVPSVVTVSGNTQAAAGAATVVIEGNNGEAVWITLGSVSLTLGTAVTIDKVIIAENWGQIRARVSAISGTGARVSAIVTI